jgi:anti-sigma factor ChrR (cupin superfamily)
MKTLSSGSVIRPAAGGFRYIDVARMPWEEPLPGIRMKVIYENIRADEIVMLFEAAPGEIAAQFHRGVEWLFVLEGSMEDDKGIIAAGNLVYWAASSRQSVRTPNGAKFLGLLHGCACTVRTGRIPPE